MASIPNCFHDNRKKHFQLSVVNSKRHILATCLISVANLVEISSTVFVLCSENDVGKNVLNA